MCIRDRLKAGDLQSRLYMLVKILNREVQLADIKQSIQMRTREDIDRQPVSYTHLDVYKRQVGNILIRLLSMKSLRVC